MRVRSYDALGAKVSASDAAGIVSKLFTLFLHGKLGWKHSATAQPFSQQEYC